LGERKREKDEELKKKKTKTKLYNVKPPRQNKHHLSWTYMGGNGLKSTKKKAN